MLSIYSIINQLLAKIAAYAADGCFLRKDQRTLPRLAELTTHKMLKEEFSQRLGYAQQAPPPVGQQQHKQQVAAGSMGRQTNPSKEDRANYLARRLFNEPG